MPNSQLPQRLQIRLCYLLSVLAALSLAVLSSFAPVKASAHAGQGVGLITNTSATKLYSTPGNSHLPATPLLPAAGNTVAQIAAELAVTPTIHSIATSSALSQTILLSFKDNPSAIYTKDNGLTWYSVPTNPWIEQNPEVEPLVGLTPRTEPGSATRMLVAANSDSSGPENGLYRSGDYGSSWSRQTFPADGCSYPDQYFHTLVASPVDPTILYLGNSCFIYEPFGGVPEYRLFTSRDAGISWQQLTSGALSHSHSQFQVLPSPVHAERVYIALDQQWLQSDDGGDHVVERAFPVTELALDAQNSEYLYGIARGARAFPSYGQRSEDGGTQWVNWAEQPCDLTEYVDNADDYAAQLLAHPVQTQVLFLLCGSGLYRSDDAGDRWTQITETSGLKLAPDFGTPGRILWAKEDGLWASSDNGDSWQQIMPDYQFSLPLLENSIFLPVVASAGN